MNHKQRSDSCYEHDREAAGSTNKMANLETDVFGFQCFMLGLFGFAPPSAPYRVKKFRIFKRLVVITVICAGLAEVINQCIMLISLLGLPSREDDIILVVLSFAPFIAESSRGILVLMLLIYKRNCWLHLAHFTDEIVNEIFPTAQERNNQMRKWRNFAVCYGLGTIIVHLGWELLIFLRDHDSVFWPLTFTDSGNASNAFVSSTTIIMDNKNIWQYTLAEVAESVPFWLSQQIFAVIIVLAFVLREGSKGLNRQINQMRDDVQLQRTEETAQTFALQGLVDRRNGNMRGEMKSLSDKVTALQSFHLRLVLLSHEINHLFGWMLFIFYGMDIVTLTGFLALLMTKDNENSLDIALNSYSVVVFGCFVTLFYIPLAQAHEQAVEVEPNLQLLIGATAKLNAKEKHVQRKLELFCSASGRHLVLFDGAGLLHVTRMFIVTGCTMTLSIAVLCYEVLNFHERQHG